MISKLFRPRNEIPSGDVLREALQINSDSQDEMASLGQLRSSSIADTYQVIHSNVTQVHTGPKRGLVFTGLDKNTVRESKEYLERVLKLELEEVKT